MVQSYSPLVISHVLLLLSVLSSLPCSLLSASSLLLSSSTSMCLLPSSLSCSVKPVDVQCTSA